MGRCVLRVLGWTAAVVTALALAYAVLRLTVYDVIRFKTAGEDMWPNLGDGALVVVNRRRSPERGDLVVLSKTGGGFLIRRVIGLPGETVSMQSAVPQIAGVAVDWKEERRWKDGPRTFAVERETLGGRSYRVIDDLNRTIHDTPVKPDGDGYWVLADHREHFTGKDSRDFGPVPRSKIRGVVSWVIETGKTP
jgi:signal peptidase I